MPPRIPNPSNRMTANPLRPVRRYRPGKAVAEEEPSSDEEEEENEEQEQQQRAASRKVPVKPKPQTRHGSTRTDPAEPAEPADDDEEGFVTEEDDEDVAGLPTPSVAKDGSAKVGPRLGGDRGVGLGGGSEDEEDEEEDEEDGDESEEDESSEEE